MAPDVKTTYYLEMLHPDDLRPVRTSLPGLRIERMTTPCPEFNSFLHIETFDPHKPFYTQGHYKELLRERGAGGPLTARRGSSILLSTQYSMRR